MRSKYFDVIDDFILTVTLDSVTTIRIGEIFAKVKGPKDFHLLREFDDIRVKARINLTLERNQKKASRLRRQCADFFGIRDPFEKPAIAGN